MSKDNHYQRDYDDAKTYGRATQPVESNRYRILSLAKTIDDFYLQRNKKEIWTPVSKVRFLALALAGEVGELCNLIKKNWRGDSKASVIELRALPRTEDMMERTYAENLRKEMADVYIYLLMLADEMQIDLEFEAINKLEAWSPK